MTHYLDLTPYSYAGGHESLMGKLVLNVGWLGGGQPFPAGETTAEFQQKLLDFCQDEYVVRLCRGFHVCELCNPGEQVQTELPLTWARRGALSATEKFACSATASSMPRRQWLSTTSSTTITAPLRSLSPQCWLATRIRPNIGRCV